MLLTTDAHYRRVLGGTFIKVLLDGQEVTTRCFAADDTQGWVGLFQVDAEGRKHLDMEGVARELVTGKVEFVEVATVDYYAARRRQKEQRDAHQTDQAPAGAVAAVAAGDR